VILLGFSEKEYAHSVWDELKRILVSLERVNVLPFSRSYLVPFSLAEWLCISMAI